MGDPGRAARRQRRGLADTARRELLEETGHAASEWHTLVDSYASPGITSERIRIFLARGLRTAEIDYQREGEEKFLRTAWVPLAEAVQAALAGKLHNGATIQGVLAAYIASSRASPGCGRRTRRRFSPVRKEALHLLLTYRHYMGTLRVRGVFLV